jgi:alpha-ketoglutarate-dependent taurine dioxygenase
MHRNCATGLALFLNTHLEATLIDVPEQPEEVVLQEYFARFINLQRYVVTETEGSDGVIKTKLLKLHPCRSHDS